MNMRIVLAICVAGLAGCANPVAPPAPASRPRAAAPAPVASVLRGNATYVEKVKMPPGVVLRIDLLDAASATRITRTELRDVGGSPIAFSVTLPAGAGPRGGYALSAELRGPRGERWFETPAPVRAIDGAELRMRRVASAGDAPSASVPASAEITHWECGELGVMSRYDGGAKTARLAFNGYALTLPLARSASGARYADSRGNEFWTKGATGSLTLAGEAARDCVEAAQGSPWNLAAARGVAFRAVGSEPGWFLEIAGTPARLDATLDYGQRRLQMPLVPVAGGFDGALDGKPVRLRIDRRTCRDGMSGQAFEATVALDVAGTDYRGCGAWLQD